MKSKPFGALFGLLALVAILGVAPAFGETTSSISMTPGAGASASAACVAARSGTAVIATRSASSSRANRDRLGPWGPLSSAHPTCTGAAARPLRSTL